MDKDALIHELGAALVGDPKVAGQPWKRYALVARLDAQQSKLNGFAYDALGSYQPATPKGFEVHNKLAALREAMRNDGKAPWGACMVRIDRDTQKITVEFEYDHPERWDVTPKTVAEIAARAAG
jgi:hypothetical protein